jgi:glycosyltransferase involved in cell wall biosynthesis
MRICQIVDLGYEAGGAERSVRLIRDGLESRGHETIVIATNRNLGDRVSFADALVPAIGDSAAARTVGRLWYQRAYRSVRRILGVFRPDVVHLHTIGEFSPAVLAATRGLPSVLTVHGPQPFTLRLLPWQLSPDHFRGGGHALKDLTAAGLMRYGYLRFLQRTAYLPGLRTVDRVLCPSRFIAEAVRPDFARTPIHHLYNGVEMPAAKAYVHGSTLLFAGRLEHVKGVHVLLRAMPLVLTAAPATRLVIVGDGAARADLTRSAADLGVDHAVSFRGRLTPDQLLPEYERATAVVVPSVWPENLPTAALAALGVGRPLVGSAVGGLPELIDHRRSGLVVPPDDPRALANALLELLLEPDTARSMAAAARDKAGDFEISTFISRLTSHYQELVAENANSDSAEYRGPPVAGQSAD